MSDIKSIDRFFKEKFKNFEISPGPHVWDAIEEKLGKKKKDRRIIPIIIRYGGIAAAIALLITLGYNLRSFDTPNTQPITDTHQKTTRENNIIPAILKENEPFSNNTMPTASDKHFSVIRNTEKTEMYHETSIAKDNNFSQNDNAVDYSSVVQREDENVVENQNKTSLLDVIEEKNNVNETIVAENVNKWSVSPNVAPVYFNSLGNGSPIDPQFKDNSKSGNVNMSYGVSIAYQVNERLSIRSGVNQVNYGYNTNDIAFLPALEANAIGNISYGEDTPNVVISDKNTPNPSSSGELKANRVSAYEGTMVQEFRYLEVPMEVKYRLLDKKIGINIIGGLSSLFLTDNTISLETNALTAQIGKANNINEVNFSSNIGLGVDYKLSDKILLNVEPMFKYQLNTFTNDTSFKPYSLGVYTGFSFRF
jgi:Outer membrane protein beta-barrel domain